MQIVEGIEDGDDCLREATTGMGLTPDVKALTTAVLRESTQRRRAGWSRQTSHLVSDAVVAHRLHLKTRNTIKSESLIIRLLNRTQRMMDKCEAEVDMDASCSDDACCVCLSRTATVRAYPCGHMVSCRLCATIMLKPIRPDSVQVWSLHTLFPNSWRMLFSVEVDQLYYSLPTCSYLHPVVFVLIVAVFKNEELPRVSLFEINRESQESKEYRLDESSGPVFENVPLENAILGCGRGAPHIYDRSIVMGAIPYWQITLLTNTFALQRNDINDDSEIKCSRFPIAIDSDRERSEFRCEQCGCAQFTGGIDRMFYTLVKSHAKHIVHLFFIIRHGGRKTKEKKSNYNLVITIFQPTTLVESALWALQLYCSKSDSNNARSGGISHDKLRSILGYTGCKPIVK
uniref:RING-type domain-containing protein n=1 Tax=Heterorhabditis bacteriophora TaxID=37862 RepID=A0A1I7X7G1_HETBA